MWIKKYCLNNENCCSNNIAKQAQNLHFVVLPLRYSGEEATH